MEGEIKELLSSARVQMEKSIKYLERELVGLKAGKLSPSLLERVKVSYYGSEVSLLHVANVSLVDQRTLLIKPYESGMLSTIEKAIIDANLGLTPMSDGQVIRLRAPQLTEERRKQLVKQAKQYTEQAKVAIRNIRKEIKNKLKNIKRSGVSEDVIKKAENELQKLTDEFVSKADAQFNAKQKEIMRV